jgi:hypothetical protein
MASPGRRQRDTLWPQLPRDRAKGFALRIAELVELQENIAVQQDAKFRPYEVGPSRPVGESTAERERIMRQREMPDADQAAAQVPNIVAAVRAGKPLSPIESVRQAAMTELMAAAARAGHGRLPLSGRTFDETCDNRWRVFGALFLTDAEMAEVQAEVDRKRGRQRRRAVTGEKMKQWRRDMRRRGWSL